VSYRAGLPSSSFLCCSATLTPSRISRTVPEQPPTSSLVVVSETPTCAGTTLPPHRHSFPVRGGLHSLAPWVRRVSVKLSGKTSLSSRPRSAITGRDKLGSCVRTARALAASWPRHDGPAHQLPGQAKGRCARQTVPFLAGLWQVALPQQAGPPGQFRPDARD
jgi:hypothetical protein